MRTTVACLLLLATALPACAAEPQPQPLPAMSPARWAEDLDFLQRELPKRHANAFHQVPRAAWEAAAADLRTRLATASDDQALVGLLQWVAQVGDGHTRVHLPAGIHRLPIAVQPFAGELRVTRTTESAQALLGGRLLRIDDVPVAEVVARVRTVVAQGESEPFVRGAVPSYLATTEVLHGLGVLADPLRARITVAGAAGEERTVAVEAVAAQPPPVWASLPGPVPLYRQQPESGFFFTWIEAAQTVYVAFRGYDDLAAHARALWQLVDARPARKIVFDLRQNGGGDYTKGRRHLVEPLRRRPRLRSYALVGNRTFSAAMNNAVDFRNAGAVLVGEPIGERPNSYQENDEMVLPRSRLVVSYSTRFYTFLPGAGSALVEPDQRIEPRWDDVAAGRDPVLDWVLAQP